MQVEEPDPALERLQLTSPGDCKDADGSVGKFEIKRCYVKIERLPELFSMDYLNLPGIRRSNATNTEFEKIKEKEGDLAATHQQKNKKIRQQCLT